MTKSGRTRARLLAAAERLFSCHGIEGASLREISRAAGLSNTSSVQYHFGGKEELLHSLFVDRMLKMEERRAAMLEEARKKDQLGDILTLMGIICLPHLDLVDADGQYHYAEFLTQYLLRYRPPMGPIVGQPMPRVPEHLFTVQGLIRDRLDDLPEGVLVRRLIIGILSFLAVLINHRNFVRGTDPRDTLETALADTLEQISCAMQMPYSGRNDAVRLPHKV